MEGFRRLFKQSYHGTFHRVSDGHALRCVREFTGCDGVRDMDTPDQVASRARAIVGKRLRYAELVA